MSPLVLSLSNSVKVLECVIHSYPLNLGTEKLRPTPLYLYAVGLGGSSYHYHKKDKSNCEGLAGHVFRVIYDTEEVTETQRRNRKVCTTVGTTSVVLRPCCV